MNARSAFVRAAAPLVALSVFASGCSKSLPTQEELPPSSANSADVGPGRAASTHRFGGPEDCGSGRPIGTRRVS